MGGAVDLGGGDDRFGADAVARIPRGIGTSSGVKETRTSSSVSSRRFWVISGVWRWVATPYADAEPNRATTTIQNIAPGPPA